MDSDKFHWILKELMPVLFKLFHKIEAEAKFHNSFYGGHCFPVERLKKKEKYRPTSLVNLEVKVLNKILAAHTQETQKRLCTIINLVYPRDARMVKHE